MQLPQLVNMFGADLQRRYGEKVHKRQRHRGQGSALGEKLRYRP